MEFCTIVVDNISLTAHQFISLCFDSEGLGLHQYSFFDTSCMEWYSYTRTVNELDPELRKEWIEDECCNWLKLNNLPSDSVAVRILITKGE